MDLVDIIKVGLVGKNFVLELTNGGTEEHVVLDVRRDPRSTQTVDVIVDDPDGALVVRLGLNDRFELGNQN